MKLLQSSVLALALLLVACEGAVSPTEPQLVEHPGPPPVDPAVQKLPSCLGTLALALSSHKARCLRMRTIQSRHSTDDRGVFQAWRICLANEGQDTS